MTFIFSEDKKQSIIQIEQSGEFKSDVRNGSSAALNRQGFPSDSKTHADCMLGEALDGKYLLLLKDNIVSPGTSLVTG